ncbi:hypothetical protein J4422_01940 [Candidatus Pacearchaeota archaeon]|nr:hypothetical protein [Candidatus Pacearchaeota archaeon]
MKIRYNSVNETEEEVKQERKEFRVSTLITIALMGSVIVADLVAPKSFIDKMDKFYHFTEIQQYAQEHGIGLR